MARYFDADALIKILDAKAEMAMGTPKLVFLSVQNMVNCLPPADVAPRAEVTREIFEELDKIMLPLLHEVSQVYIYAKLKKKYTGAETEPQKGDHHE